MTNTTMRGAKPAGECERNQIHRLGLVIFLITMLAPGGGVAERAAAQGDDADTRRGLQTNTAEASPGYVLFNPRRRCRTWRRSTTSAMSGTRRKR